MTMTTTAMAEEEHTRSDGSNDNKNGSGISRINNNDDNRNENDDDGRDTAKKNDRQTNGQREKNNEDEKKMDLIGFAANEVTKTLLLNLKLETTEQNAETGTEGGSKERDGVSNTPSIPLTSRKSNHVRDDPSLYSEGRIGSNEGTQRTNASTEPFVDTEAMKDTPLYKVILKSARYQRDAYLAGNTYAEKRKQEDESSKDASGTGTNSGVYNPLSMYSSVLYSQQRYSIPYDPTGLGNQQIVSLFAWFIPSETVYNFALPHVLDLPSVTLYDRILNQTAGIIPSSQTSLDRTIKYQLLSVLRDDKQRKFIKNLMRGHILRAYENNNQ